MTSNVEVRRDSQKCSSVREEMSNTPGAEKEVKWDRLPKKYSSISNLGEKLVENVGELHGSDNWIWSVEEKIHGANCGVHYNNGEVRFSSRNLWVEDTKLFNNLHIIEDELKGYVKKLAVEMNMVDGYFTVYGEICGNGYPSKFLANVGKDETPKIISNGDHKKPVQNSIYYSPNVEFYAFDIYNGTVYLSVPVRNNMLDAAGFLRGRKLMEGSLKECIKFEVEGFKTTLPKQLDENYLDVDDNIAEGVIIRPSDTVYYRTGRVIFKKKSSNHLEVEKKGTKMKKMELEIVEAVVPNDVIEFLNGALKYITLNRLSNVMSKTKCGKVYPTIEDYPTLKMGVKNKLKGLLVSDALKEYIRDEDMVMPKEYKKFISNSLKKECNKIIN